MSTHKHIDVICCAVLAVTMILAALFSCAERFGIKWADTAVKYAEKLFDTSAVHSIDIVMDDWESFIGNCRSEEYSACTVVIDNEAYGNVAIRGKGNTSLTQVEAYGNDRYSFKIEFDHYENGKSYYGLDKLCLNNIIQDNTYMKDYLCYRMMGDMGVASPLCSYAYITVNGEDWGLYLAVEGVEEGFLRRNFGSGYGELYKPDSTDMGGGRGNGAGFDMNELAGDIPENFGGEMPNDFDGGMCDFDGKMPNGFDGEMPDFDGEIPDFGGGMRENLGGLMSSDDVLLKYIDDEAESYPNIFDNAKTDVTDADKTRLTEALKRLSEGDDVENAVDTDAVIRYFAVHDFVLNFDSYTGSMIHNYYLYEENGVLQMIPWDYNLAFGGFGSAESAEKLVNYPIDTPVSGGDIEDRPMLSWIFASEEYTERYHECLSELIDKYFDGDSFEGMLDRLTEMIAPYVERDPTKFCTYGEFELGSETLKKFCLLRAESIEAQLGGKIGTTHDTQEAGTLVRADGINISDMGSMNNTAGGAGDAPQRPDGNFAEMPDDVGDGAPNMNNTAGGAGDAPQRPDGNFAEMPDDVGDGAPNMNNTAGGAGDAPQRPDGNFAEMPDVTGNGVAPDDGEDSAAETAEESPSLGGGESGTWKGNGEKREPFDGDPSHGGVAADGAAEVHGEEEPLLLLGTSTAVLVLGIAFAALYKRRG